MTHLYVGRFVTYSYVGYLVSHIFDSFICGRVRDSFIHVGEFVTPEWRGGKGLIHMWDSWCLSYLTHSYVGEFVTHSFMWESS